MPIWCNVTGIGWIDLDNRWLRPALEARGKFLLTPKRALPDAELFAKEQANLRYSIEGA